MPEQERAYTPETVAQRWIAAFNAHDAAAIADLYCEDATLLDSGMLQPRRGRKEIASWFRWRFSSIPTISYSAHHVERKEDGRAVVTWVARGKGPRIFGRKWLERPFQVDGESIFKINDGLIAQQWGSYDHLLVLQQIAPVLKWLPKTCATLVYALYMWRKGPRAS